MLADRFQRYKVQIQLFDISFKAHVFRMADVIPRGFSGYNTRWCKILIPNILDTINTNDVSCVTIFLGANDCCLPTSDQHVPVNEYQKNLEYIVDLLEHRSIDRQKIVFITAPIYFQSHFAAKCLEEGKSEPLRSQERPKIYAEAMIELGKRLSVSVIDTYSAFVADGRGDELFSDGLHLSPAGSDLLYNLIVKDIESRVLAFRGESSATETMNYAQWTDIDPKNLERSILKLT